jgi:uncharacterized protein YcfJ
MSWETEGTPISSPDTATAYITVAEADTYFATRLGAGAYWSDSTDAAVKLAALQTAENALLAEYALEDTDTCKNAICEQALFLLRDPAGVEARAALRAQGVTAAGVVGESYSHGDGQAICPYARRVLVGLLIGGAQTGTVPWER